MKYWAAVIGLVLVVIGFSGCRKTQRSELVGTWVLKSSSKANIPSPLQQCSPRVVLKPEGTFQVFELPGYFATDEHAPKLDSGNGEWMFRTIDGQEIVQLNFSTITAGTTELPVPYGNQLSVSSWPSLSLDYSIGGPDSGVRMEFEKETNQ